MATRATRAIQRWQDQRADDCPSWSEPEEHQLPTGAFERRGVHRPDPRAPGKSAEPVAEARAEQDEAGQGSEDPEGAHQDDTGRLTRELA